MVWVGIDVNEELNLQLRKPADAAVLSHLTGTRGKNPLKRKAKPALYIPQASMQTPLSRSTISQDLLNNTTSLESEVLTPPSAFTAPPRKKPKTRSAPKVFISGKYPFPSPLLFEKNYGPRLICAQECAKTTTSWVSSRLPRTIPQTCSCSCSCPKLLSRRSRASRRLMICLWMMRRVVCWDWKRGSISGLSGRG